MCMISIIVPVYNEEEHIECCVKSVLQQTFKNWGLMIALRRKVRKFVINFKKNIIKC